jgi:hypothetical protein
MKGRAEHVFANGSKRNSGILEFLDLTRVSLTENSSSVSLHRINLKIFKVRRIWYVQLNEDEGIRRFNIWFGSLVEKGLGPSSPPSPNHIGFHQLLPYSNKFSPSSS